MDFGAALRHERAPMGLSQRALAARAGLDPSAVSKLERNVRDPRLTTICALAAALEISATELARSAEDR